MATDSIETAKQENASRVYFESYIEKRQKYGQRNSVAMHTLVKSVYPNVSQEWMESFRKQAEALKSYLGNLKGYTYSRDTGFMPFIEGVAKTKCGVSVKDRWNPADIYMIKSDEESQVKSKIIKLTSGTDKDQNLIILNTYMKDLVNSKTMIPISLKAILAKTSKAKAELSNMGGVKTNMEFKLKPGSVKCLLSIGHKNASEFDTGEMSFDFFVGGEEIHGQARNFQYSKPRNLVQTDLTPKGRSGGAKLGKVSSVTLDDFLKKNKMTRPVSASKDPNIDAPGEWTESNIKYWIKFINDIKNKKVGGSLIDLGNFEVKISTGSETGPEAIIRNGVLFEGTTTSSAGRFSSKLTGLRWVKIWIDISEKGLMDEWLMTLYFGAKKEFGPLNGPFLKIY